MEPARLDLNSIPDLTKNQSPSDASAPDIALSTDGGTVLPSLKPGWNIFKLGGQTICSRGKEYAISVHPGKVNKLVVNFEGGGACWSYDSCSASVVFKEDVDSLLNKASPGYSDGIFNHKNSKNPFKDWYHVFIPYCTGDVHWGNQVATYSSKNASFKIHHKGATNVQAALQWVYKNFMKPEKIFVTGCSAGSYGSILWAAHLAKHYKQSKLYQMGDSGAGMTTSSFLEESFSNWNPSLAMPGWIPALDTTKVKLTNKDLTYFYYSIANYYKNHTFSQFNRYNDQIQVLFFTMGGGNSTSWSKKMLTSIDTIIKNAPNFHAYLTSGASHCITPSDNFYSVEVEGTKLTDWLSDMVNDKPIKTVRCARCK